MSLLAEKGFPLPEPGYELTDALGAVIATAELGWNALKLAFLVEEELEFENLFNEKKWAVFRISDVILDIDKFVAVIAELKK